MFDEIDYSKYDDDLSVLDLEHRIIYHLEYAGINTIGKLLEMLNKKTFRISNIGAKSCAEITAALIEYLTKKMENCIC